MVIVIMMIVVKLTITLPAIFRPGSLPNEPTGSFDADGHIGEHERDALVVDDGLAHRLARSAPGFS
jgi:hypothetical protein